MNHRMNRLGRCSLTGLTVLLAGCGQPPSGAVDSGQAATSTAAAGRGIVDPDIAVPDATDPDATETVTTQALVYQPPITISRGGTYVGNWQSLDPDVPAVEIRTDEPVTIERSNIRGRGRLINVPWNHSKVTVRNTRATGLNPNRPGVTQGRFIQTYNGDSLTVEHNDLSGSLGIHVNTYAGNRDGVQTIRVRYNKVRNLMAQASDGAGGYLTGNARPADWDFGNFVQLYEVRDVPGIEIAWNQVINEPRKSRVEDTINFCRSGGREDGPAQVHDNYIQGGFPYDPAADFTGTGINTGDCAEKQDSGADGTLYGFVRAHDNQVVGYASGGIGSTAGHDQDIFNNRVVSASVLDDGTRFAAIGLTVWDAAGLGRKVFFNNAAHDNVVGVMRLDGPYFYRCDGWWPEQSKVPDGSDVWCKSGWYGNTALQGPVTRSTEQAEYALWKRKLAANTVTLGPVLPAPLH